MDEEEELIRLKEEMRQEGISTCRVILVPGCMSAHQLFQLKKIIEVVKNSLAGQDIEWGDVFATRFHALILAQCEELEYTIKELENIFNGENNNETEK